MFQQFSGTPNILLITTMPGAENCARTLASNLQCEVELAESRKSGLQMLRGGHHQTFDVVVIEESLVEADSAWADAVWQAAGMAIPLQINFALFGVARLAREIRASLSRLQGEQLLLRKAVAAELENELKSSVTGLLLESELALREPGVSVTLEPKLRHLVELASNLRERLRTPGGITTSSGRLSA